jgi:thymidylate kinase
MKKRIYDFDGADGSGKTTQLKILAKRFEDAGIPVYRTRLLGGDGNDFVQSKVRDLLLSPEFPADSVEDEERLFAATDLRGLKLMRDWLRDVPNGVAFQDRALASHIVYARAKDMSWQDIIRVHKEVREMYGNLADEFGTVNLIIVPEDERMAMERVKARGETVTPRLENTETQRAVIEGMRAFRFGEYATIGGHSGAVHMCDVTEALLTVRRNDTIGDVSQMIEDALHPDLSAHVIMGK